MNSMTNPLARVQPAKPAETPQAARIAQNKAPGGNETILLVEDDEHLRRLLTEILRHYGYNVLETANSTEAMRLWERSGHLVNLVLTDMLMPGGITGLDLAKRLQLSRPGLKVVISSGSDLLEKNEPLPPALRFLPKPYSPGAVARIVRECLDGASG